MSQNKDKKWLIKNNDIISGPYTEEEVSKEWTEGNISPFATTCLPKQQYWLFITNYPQFAHLQHKTKETTTTENQMVSQTVTATITETNEPSTEQPDLKKQTSESPKVTQENLSPQTAPPASQQQDSLKQPETGSATKNKINLTLIFCGIAGLSIALIAVIIFQLLTQKSSPTITINNSTQTQTMQSYFKSGYYSKAIEYLQNHNAQGEEQTLLKILQLQLHNDIDSGKELIESPTAELSPYERQMVSASIHLKNSDFDSAKSIFTELTQMEDSPQEIRTAALNNLILLSAKNGDCIQTGQYIKQGQSSNLSSFALALCVMKSQTTNTSQKRAAEKLLQSIIKKEQDYYQESLLVMTYLRQQENRSNEMLSNIQTLLNIDPHLTNNHYHNVFVDRAIFSWNELIPLCQNIYNTQKDNKFYIAFYAYCLARFQDYESAKHFIQQSRDQDSKDSLLSSLHAYIARATHSEEEAVLILGDSVQNNQSFNYELPYILQAQFCENNQDWDCAIEYWLLILENNPNSLSALGGMVYSKYQKSLFKETNTYMKRGLKSDTDNTYSPMIFVHLELKNRSIN